MMSTYLSAAAAAAASLSNNWMQSCSSGCYHAQVVAVAVVHRRTMGLRSSLPSALQCAGERSWDLHDTFMHESAQRSSSSPSVVSTTRDNCTVPVSSHYRQDTREIGRLPPVQDVQDLSQLLAQRYQAKRRCHAAQQKQQQQQQQQQQQHCVDHLEDTSPEITTSDNSTTTEHRTVVVTELDAQLKQRHGVQVYDHPPIWSRLLDSPPPPAVRRQTAAKRAAVMQRAFGPTGHAYQRVGGATCAKSPLCDGTYLSDIHNLLSRYTLHRLRSLSSSSLSTWTKMAAALRLELEIHGVRVNDETLQWTTDPWHTYTDASQDNATTCKSWKETTAHSMRTVPTGNVTLARSEYMWRLRQRAMSVEWPKYEQDALSLPIASLLPRLISASSRSAVASQKDTSHDTEYCHRLEQRIIQLVLQRWIAMQRDETALARSLARELYGTYLVRVNDATMTWSIVNSHLAEDSTLSDRHQDLMPLKANAGQVKAQDLQHSANPTMFPSTFLFAVDCDETAMSYRCSSCSQPLHDTIWLRVKTLIQERIHKREEGKFLEADAIRRELWYTYVRMCDLLLWRFGFIPDHYFVFSVH
jgi:hypothetical protein